MVKFSRLAYLLFFKRHRYPGVKDWELEKYLGRNYEFIVDEFNKYISGMGLTVKRVELEEDGRKVKYYVVQPIYPLSLVEAKSFGWRIDDMAILSVCISYIVAGDGKAERREVVNILKEKIPEWRINRVIDRFIKLGYLVEDGDFLRIGLRTYLEVDIQSLISMVIGYEHEAVSETSLEDSSSRPRGSG